MGVGISPLELITAKGQLVPLVFTQDQVAASQNAAAMKVIEAHDGTTLATLDVTEYTVAWDFEIVGISISASAARTAGTLTVDATINGAVTGVQAVLDGTNMQYHYGRNSRGNDMGRAGGRVGVKLTTDASWAPTTADVAVVVWVLAYLDAI